MLLHKCTKLLVHSFHHRCKLNIFCTMRLAWPPQKVFLTGFVLLCTALGVSLSSCQREVWDSNPEHALRFSTDTLFFDTVFTTVGSITLPVKVYNDHDGTLLIDEIELESGLVSQFRVNVNGASVTNTAQPVRMCLCSQETACTCLWR